MATRKSELVITCNAKAVKDVFEYLNRQLADVKQKLKDLNAKGEKSGWTEQMKKDFRDLTKQATAIDSAIIHNQQSMVKYGQVMKDLAGSKLKDLKSALREATTSLNKMSEKSPGRQKLIDDIKRIKDQISGTSGLTMSFRQAQTQLKNLDNVSMEKLKQGLAAIKSQLDNPNIGNKWRRSLEQMQQQYQAAMAVRTAPVGTMPVTKMNAQQLGAERTALMSAIAATSGVKGYEGQTSQYEQRLKAINQQLTILSEKEKKAAADAKQLQATQEAAQTVRAVYRGQAVELEKLQAAYKTLQARQQQFAGTNDAKARAAAQQMALLKNRIDKVTAAMQAEIKIDKQFLKTATTGQLQNALTQLQQKLQSLTSQQGAAARKLKADMKAVETQIRRNTGAVQQQGNTFGTAIKNITAYVGVFGAFNFIKGKVMSVYQSNLKLSDSLADIRKVSGLTSEEINKLYSNISKIDSRNTIETLNKLAYTGAKLGIGQNYGVQGLTGFVRAAEQVQMALGEDLGEEALPALAKLTEVMNLIPRYGVEQAMQKSASAIFQLGATSTATGKNIVEFSKRLMGLANVSRVSADELLAIGSAADAMGLMPEVAATAFNKLFTSIQKGHNMIEKSLGLVQGSINENFAKGQTIKSIVDIFDAMNKRGNMNALDGIFKDLGSDGARLVAVMTTMADRVDILKTHLATSTKAFKDGTAVINEYMIQNETANALMERASNLWAKAFTNPEGVDMVKQLAEKWYEVSKALTQSENSMYALHNSLEIITNRLVELVKILPFLIKMFTWFAVFGGIRMMVNSFIALVAAINAARTAVATLQVVMNSNWVLAGISAAAAGISLFVDSMNAAAEAAEKAQKRQAELDEQLLKSKNNIEKVAAPMESYKKALDESNYSLEKRNQLLKDLLKSDYQQYLDYLGIEIDGAIDLAKAYAQVVKVLKQKKAYEEREQYRDEVNQNNKMDRMRAGMQFGQTAKSLGAGAEVDAEWLRRRHNLPVEDVMASVIKSAGGSVKAMDFGRGVSGNAYYDKSGNLIEAKVIDRLRKNIREYSTSRNTENRLNKEVDDLYKEEVGDFDMEKFQDSLFKAQLKRKGQLDNLKPDKDAIAAAKKAAQEQKQAMRKDLKDVQEASTGIMSKLEEYYRLQETAISEARADGKLTEDQANEMVRSLNIFKNESLATARRAVVTGDTKEWDKLKTTILPAVMSDTSEVSRTLLDTIQKVVVEKLHDDLAKFNGSKGVFGLSSRAFFDQMRAKAAGNEREAARLRAKIQNEVEKALLQYQFVEKANQQMRKDVENMGITTETYEQWAKRMQQGVEKKPDTRVAMGQNARDEILQQFKWDWEQRMQQPARTFNGEWNPASFPFNSDNEEQVQEWFRQFVTNAKWTSGIPKLEEWLKDGEKYKAEIRKFYESLILIQESSMQKSESVSPLAPVDETWMKRGQQGLDDLFSYSISDEQAYRQMGNKFMDMGVINFRYNIDNEEEARQWVKQFATDARGDLEGWAQAFPQLSEWIDIIKRKEQGETLGEAEQKALEEAMPAIRNLFDEMMRHADRLNKAMKDAFQHEKEQQESRFRIAGYKDQEEQTDKVYSNQAKQQETGAGQSFAQMLGLGSIAQDPEILQIQNRIYWRNLELEDARKRLDAMKAMQDEEIAKLRETAASKEEIAAMEQQHAQDRAGLEQLVADRQAALTEQMQNLTTKAMQEMQKRVNAVKTLTKPFSDAANSIGKKLGDMIRGAEEDSITWEEIWKNMLLAVAESVIEMGAQYAENLVMQQAFNRASEAETMQHTTTEVTAGIAAGSAKTIGQLGWWGIPLIAVISALLMGLLQAALSTSGKSSTNNNAAKKVKLASGMLTYDEGNVQTVVGDDGRVYRAKEQRSLPEGVSMVTEPIATRVNGQQALVGERGPEIVIGRKTTRAIQMNRPDLLRDLALIDRGITTRKVRTFDEGNLSDLASAIRPTDASTESAANDGSQTIDAATAEALRQMPAAMAAFAQVMTVIQKQGIPAKIQKYGTGGLIDEVQSGLKFVSKYK